MAHGKWLAARSQHSAIFDTDTSCLTLLRPPDIEYAVLPVIFLCTIFFKQGEKGERCCKTVQQILHIAKMFNDVSCE
jgi:hypothetical protein